MSGRSSFFGIVLPLIVLCSDLTPRVQVGVAWTEHGTAVVAMSGPPLGPGTKLTLVSPEPPQRLASAVVRQAISDDSEITARMPGPYYQIVSAVAGKDLPRLAVAVVGEPRARRLGRMWSLRLGRQLPDVRARICASMEGVHLTLWSGEPLKGRREWHAYYYAGYDMEPTCRPADVRDGA
jgi:hypothetical protein